MSSAPEDDESPRALLDRGFWASLVLGGLFILAGVAVAVLAPRLSAKPPLVTAPTHPAASPLGERPRSR